ncbi:MAG: ABC transporter ATP-binding protein [Rhodospirillales bacterium]
MVAEVNVSLRQGETVGLIGPNGAGKSSLLRALAGLLPCRGKVLLDGISLADLPVRQRARRLAYLAQGGRSQWAVSAESLVGLGLQAGRSPFAGPSAADRARLQAVLAEFDLTALAGRSVLTLSGGELARCLLARALVGAPALLLADEPVAALDPGQQLRVMDHLQRRRERGLGVMLVVHDLSLAARYCDRLLLLDRGRIRIEGAAEKVLGSQELTQAYGVSFAQGQVGAVTSVAAQPIRRESRS